MLCRKKPIPQFDTTYYLGMFPKVHTVTPLGQTLDVVGVEQTCLFEVLPELALRLLN